MNFTCAMKAPSLLTLAASAVLITSASATVTIDWVTVGNAGNAAQSEGNRAHSFIEGDGFGAVGYEYQIGKYEVTNAQYGAFLNAKAATDSYGLYNSNMASYGITQGGVDGSYTYSVTGGLENRPVVYVSWFDAARFSNWMANGQGNGDTEDGSYSLLGATSGVFMVNTGAKAWIPTENEWYKAAYYNGGTSTYSLFPNGQDSVTEADATYRWSSDATDVGYGTSSSYGTFGQGGNVWEWNDAVTDRYGYWERGTRGGSFNERSNYMRSSEQYFQDPSYETTDYGFRLASAVPEPSSLVLTMLASGVVLTRRKR
jgi:sulfatase modifying factor 1